MDAAGRCGRSSPRGRLGQEPSLLVVHKEDLLCKVEVAVAWPLPDEKALWRGEAQAVQGDVDDFGLANRRRHVPGGPAWRQQVCHTAVLLAASQCHPYSARRCAGAGRWADSRRQAGEALPQGHIQPFSSPLSSRGLRWYVMGVKGLDRALRHPLVVVVQVT